MKDTNIFEINIALANDKGNLSQNFFYQKFDDYNNTKLREVIRIVNEFAPEPKPYEYKPSVSLSLAMLNSMTEQAQLATKLSGSSLNAELVHVINHWLAERT